MVAAGAGGAAVGAGAAAGAAAGATAAGGATVAAGAGTVVVGAGAVVVGAGAVVVGAGSSGGGRSGGSADAGVDRGDRGGGCGGGRGRGVRPGRYLEHGDHYQEENSGRHRELEGEQRTTLAEGGPGQTGTPAWRPAVMADVAGGNDQPRIIELGTEGSLEFLFNSRITLFNAGSPWPGCGSSGVRWGSTLTAPGTETGVVASLCAESIAVDRQIRAQPEVAAAVRSQGPPVLRAGGPQRSESLVKPSELCGTRYGRRGPSGAPFSKRPAPPVGRLAPGVGLPPSGSGRWLCRWRHSGRRHVGGAFARDGGFVDSSGMRGGSMRGAGVSGGASSRAGRGCPDPARPCRPFSAGGAGASAERAGGCSLTIAGGQGLTVSVGADQSQWDHRGRTDGQDGQEVPQPSEGGPTDCSADRRCGSRFRQPRNGQ